MKFLIYFCVNVKLQEEELSIEGPFRMITQGQELTVDYDDRSLYDMGFKDNQVYILYNWKKKPMFFLFGYKLINNIYYLRFLACSSCN